jgi:hypothetical protein
MAARVSTGAAWPTGEAGKLGRVILVCGEDDASDTIVPRLQAVGADLRQIKLITAVNESGANGSLKRRSLSLERDLERLGAALIGYDDVALVVIDPISAYLGKVDSHNNAEIRALMDPLSRLAQAHRVAVMLVSHLNKGSGEAMYRTSGSVAFVAAARSVFAVVKDDSNPAHRFMLPIKTNLAPDSRGIGYEVREASNQAPHIVWDQQTVAGNEIESLMQHTLPGEGERLREAIDWLRNKLSAGPVPATQIVRDARKDGIAERTLERAKQKLGAKAAPIGGRWEWRLPLQSSPAQVPIRPAQPPQHLVPPSPLALPWELGPPPAWVTTFPLTNL